MKSDDAWELMTWYIHVVLTLNFNLHEQFLPDRMR